MASDTELRERLLHAMKHSMDPAARNLRETMAELTAEDRERIQRAIVQFMGSNVIFDVSMQALQEKAR